MSKWPGVNYMTMPNCIGYLFDTHKDRPDIILNWLARKYDRAGCAMSEPSEVSARYFNIMDALKEAAKKVREA